LTIDSRPLILSIIHIATINCPLSTVFAAS
jgi:hypothetical protein